MAINKRGGRYIVDWWADGKRYRKFFDRQHDARDFAAKVHNDKRAGTHVAPVISMLRIGPPVML